MSDISATEIDDIVTARNRFIDTFDSPMVSGEAKGREPYAFSDIDIRILYLVHGKTMGYDIPHCDTESTDPSKSGDRYTFAPNCFDADGSWKVLPKWVNDRMERYHFCDTYIDC